MAETKDNEKSKAESKKSEKTKREEKKPEEVLKEKKRAGKQAAKKAKPVKKSRTAKASRRAQAGARRGKNYLQAKEKIDLGRVYTLDDAVKILPETSFVKFDASVELHIPLNVDPKQADQLVRGTVVLPHGSGKSKKVAVVTSADKVKKAKDAGADKAGEDDLLKEIEQGKLDFDILVATPDVMAKLAKLAKILGPKGLMPNPKSGTVSDKLEKTVKELKGGREEFRVDPHGILHQVVGKLSYKPDQLATNIKVFVGVVQQAKPSSVKGAYIKKIWLTTSMGPAIKVDLKSV